MKVSNYLTLIVVLVLSTGCNSNIEETEVKTEVLKKPIMGWSSWNNYRININENIIKEQADAMVSNGLKDLGYTFINTDDGYFGGRDSLGNLMSCVQKWLK